MKHASLFSLGILLACGTALAALPPTTDALRGPTNQILIPVAGNTQGANGAFFHSDITIINYRDSEQTISAQWLAQGQRVVPGAPIPKITIAPRSGIVSEDFVASYLGVQGLGAILLTAITPTGQTDPGGLIYATSRIWTPQPGSTGTTSQTIEPVPVAAINAAEQVTIVGLRIDDRYRTNVGIVNLDPNNDVTFDIVQSTDNPTFAPVQTTVTVPAMSMLQRGLFNMKSTSLQIVIVPRRAAGAPPSAYANKWLAYGSSIDNVTGDSWSQLAFPQLNP